MFFYIDWSVCQPSECFILSSMLLVNRVHRLFVEIGMNSLLFLCFRLRMFCQHLISRRWFDNSVLFFIALNCITLAMERPDIPPHSTVSMHLVLTVSSCIHPYIYDCITLTVEWPDIPPHRTVSMCCVSALSLLISIHPWLYHTGDLTFIPTELWVCTVCRPCLFLYAYIHDCITLAVEQPNIPPNWIWFLVSLHPQLYHTGTGVTWHSSWVCTVITLCLHVSIYILDCITLAVAWPDISHDFLSWMKIRLYLWFSCRWLGGIRKMITFFFFFTHTFLHFEEIMCRFISVALVYLAVNMHS